MPTDNQVDKLIINQLTKQQYEAIENPSSTELYVTEDLEIPEGVYTKENLVGGKDISITERQISGGDDEHTYLLMHFNDTFENNGTHNTSAISVDSSMGLPNSVTYSAGKFDKCATATTYPSGVMWPWTKFNNSAVSSVKDYFTIDCWVYYNQTAVATFENTKGTRFVPFNVVASDGQFNMQLGSADAYVAYGTSQTSAGDIYSALVNNSWNHLAITFSNGGNTKFYINGSLIKTYSGVTLANGVEGVEVRQVPEGCGIDELRLSNVIRWDSEFDVPTKPYNASVTVLNEINNTKLIVPCTQAEYDALVSGGTVDANTLYVIISGS